MKNRRMFSRDIVETGKFYLLDPKLQVLYLHLSMNADDDGYVDSFMVLSSLRLQEEDLRVLEAKSLITIYDDLVVWINDWTLNNQIRKDRYIPSIYSKKYGHATYPENNLPIIPDTFPSEESDLQVTIGLPSYTNTVTDGLPSIGKVSTDKIREGNSPHPPFSNSSQGEPEKKPPKATITNLNDEESLDNPALIGSMVKAYPECNVLYQVQRLKKYVHDHNKRVDNYPKYLETWLKRDLTRNANVDPPPKNIYPSARMTGITMSDLDSPSKANAFLISMSK